MENETRTLDLFYISLTLSVERATLRVANFSKEKKKTTGCKLVVFQKKFIGSLIHSTRHTKCNIDDLN